MVYNGLLVIDDSRSVNIPVSGLSNFDIYLGNAVLLSNSLKNHGGLRLHTNNIDLVKAALEFQYPISGKYIELVQTKNVIDVPRELLAKP